MTPGGGALGHSAVGGLELRLCSGPSLLLCLVDEVLESFDNHPPIILPSGGFQVDLEVETLDDNVYRHLLYIRHFLWSLRSKSPHAGDSLEPEPPKVALMCGGSSVPTRAQQGCISPQPCTHLCRFTLPAPLL